MALVDVVVVSYNSRETLRTCVRDLTGLDWVQVIVVDNASTDDSLSAVADLDVLALPQADNRGFSHGCNVGWRAGGSPFVLLLNPDAAIEPGSLRAIVAPAEADPSIGAVAPRILHEDGRLDFSLRRYPRVRSTFAQALFLHRLFPRSTWVDELIRDESAYLEPSSPEWVSGACILVRRTALEQLDGLDEGFFMYCEDIDLCRRLQTAGWALRYEPDAVVTHEGGASAPRASLLPVLAASRLRYAAKHRGSLGALAERVGIGLGALTHVVVSRGGRPVRKGHLRALRLSLSRSRTSG